MSDLQAGPRDTGIASGTTVTLADTIASLEKWGKNKESIINVDPDALAGTIDVSVKTLNSAAWRSMGTITLTDPKPLRIKSAAIVAFKLTPDSLTDVWAYQINGSE